MEFHMLLHFIIQEELLTLVGEFFFLFGGFAFLIYQLKLLLEEN